MIWISHENLLAWLDHLAGTRTLVAPTDVGKGHIHYRPVSNSQAVCLDYTRPDLSAKEFFFPHTERLMRIEKHHGNVTLHDRLLEEHQVLFGLRPCDAQGVLALDALFRDQEPADAHYVRRRELTTLIGLSCPQMWESCFCTSVGGAPDDATYLDLLLTAVDGGYAVRPVTPRGQEILAAASTEEKRNLVLPDIPCNEPVPVLPPEQWAAHFNSPYWARLGDRCLSCKLCTFVCPTCRCFDLRDEPLASGTEVVIHERMRVWDACTAPNYRTIAGGHNSRPLKGQRIRNRYYCKFNYYPTDFGPLGCVGCGRCIDVCPVNIDIAEMLRAVAAMAPQAEEES